MAAKKILSCCSVLSSVLTYALIISQGSKKISIVLVVSYALFLHFIWWYIIQDMHVKGQKFSQLVQCTFLLTLCFNCFDLLFLLFSSCSAPFSTDKVDVFPPLNKPASPPTLFFLHRLRGIPVKEIMDEDLRTFDNTSLSSWHSWIFPNLLVL